MLSRRALPLAAVLSLASGQNAGAYGGQQQPLSSFSSCPAQVAGPPVGNLVYANSPTCPDANGKIYQTDDGATLYFHCCARSPATGADIISQVPAVNLNECANQCSMTDSCHSVQYSNQGVAAGQECKLIRKGEHSTVQAPAGDAHYAFVISPPAIESHDSATIICSRECPYADGQQLATSAGEAFRIDCGRRHGTQVIYRDTQDTLEDCIESCGNLLACHSVDYDTKRKVCYYGNHQGSPTISSPSFGSAYSMGCAGACDKTCCEDECEDDGPPTCGEPGFEWALWRGFNSWRLDPSPPLASYDPTVFATMAPILSGLTNKLEITTPNDLYGQNVTINVATVIHQGFFLAPETGDYTFSFGQADDVVLLWLGPAAYSGWTRANADVERTYLAAGGGQTQTTRTLQKGKYYPLRVAWADQGGGVAMSLKISGPDGVEMSAEDGGYFRTKACDGSYGDFPPYG